ncbi:MAG: hypothetical protein JRH11_13465, partial [Deltaproteobacteria bacterium]|nr:hypothetical protein [Deltaproteobacteria bacterium]
MSPSPLLRGLALLGVLPLSVAAFGPQQSPAGLIPPPRVIQAAGDASWNGTRSAEDPAWGAFLAEAGGSWQARWDRRTDRLALASGSGMPFASVGESLPKLESLARAFMGHHSGLFRIPAGVDLRLSPGASVSFDGGRLQTLTFLAERGGVPVEDAFVLFRIHSGRLVQFGSARIGDDLGLLSPIPRFDSATARDAALTRLAKALGASDETSEQLEPSEELDEGRLVVLPHADDPRSYAGIPGRGLSYRLAWRGAFRLENGSETWAWWHDALTGEPIGLADSNFYQCPQPAVPRGRVTGGVLLGPIEEVEESIRGMGDAVVRNPATFLSDPDGSFAFDPAQPVNAVLRGPFLDVFCDGCSRPTDAFVERIGGGDLAFGTGGSDGNGNGWSTGAERNVWYHLSTIRRQVSKHLTDAETNGWLTMRNTALVNQNSECRASWDGTQFNFYSSGANCNNSGLMADVIQHEWGHGLDGATHLAPGDPERARAEGLCDTIAALYSHDSRIAPYFVIGDRNGFRNISEGFRGLMTVSNVASFCDPGLGILGFEPHCEGEIFAQANWHLARLLRDKATAAGGSEAAGWYAMESLFYRHLTMSDSYLPDQTDSAYDAYVFVDDDDGNLANGTPNGAEIDLAYVHHELASATLVGGSPACTPPAAPTPALERLIDPDNLHPQVRITWPSDMSGSVVAYELYKNDRGGTVGDLPVATIVAPFPATVEVFDDDVVEGTEVFYRVASFDASGCVSIDDTETSVALDPVAHFVLAGFAVDDSLPPSNLNGFPEPGERVSLSVSVTNAGAAATGVVAVLTSSHPGVTLLTDRILLGNVGPNETVAAGPVLFEFLIDASTPCLDSIPFTVSFEAVEGCSTGSLAVETGFPGFAPWLIDDMETDTGWTVNPDGDDPATSGIWVRVDPNPTTWQHDDDHTPDPGVMAWVTGNALGGADDDDDVDAVTTLLSPVFNLGGQSGFRLSYWYDIATENFWDLLLAEYSLDGAPFIRLVGHSTNSEGYQQYSRVFDSPVNTLQIRFDASDQGFPHVAEFAVDDLLIEEPTLTCEFTPTEPVLTLEDVLVGDEPAAGGVGNGNGFFDVGETIKLAFDLMNRGNETAVNVRATLVPVDLPPGLLLNDDDLAWVDLDPAQLERSGAGATPQAEIELPIPDVDCVGEMQFDLLVEYDGVTAGPRVLVERLVFPIGQPIPVTRFADDFDGGNFGW